MSTIRIPPVPKWLAEVRPESALNSRDFAALLGMGKYEFLRCVRNADVPSPDFTTIGHSKHSGRRKESFQWYVRTVLKFLKGAA